MSASVSEGESPKRVSRWKNPFVWAFVIGIAALTVLPIFQRRFLRAPPPLKSLSPWEFRLTNGKILSSKELRGKVWVAGFAPNACDSVCVALQRQLAEVMKATGDLSQPVAVVTFVGKNESPDEVQPDLRQLPWFVVSATYSEMETLQREVRQALWTFRGDEAQGVAPAVEALPGYLLVDQNGDVRGFWRSDDLSRGNLINAARMLSRYGPNP